MFQNTAYYNPSIRTDATGKAKIDFILPDNITDYRIIAISNTRESLFGTAEKTIEVRKDYTLEAQAPMIARQGDTFTITASAFNATKQVTNTEITLIFGTGTEALRQKQALVLSPTEAKSVDFTQKLPDGATGIVPYTLELRQNGILLDSVTHMIRIPTLPIMENTSRLFGFMTGTTLSLQLPKIEANTDRVSSSVEVTVASSYVAQMEDAIRSLVQYPYGCIEQTISSTLPNAIALSFSDSIGINIDRNQAQENLKKGLAKILRMQHYTGGWTYWEGDAMPNAHITPYVLRSLVSFRDLGQTIPQEVFDAGVNYIISNEAEYKTDANMEAEIAWTLALLKNDQALSFWNMVDPTKLDRHGYIAYAYGAYFLGKLTPDIQKKLSEKIYAPNEETYWYWDNTADKAIYARFLLDSGDTQNGTYLIDTLARSIDVNSYYVSTQSKIQLFLTLSKQLRMNTVKTSSSSIALRGEALIADATIPPHRGYTRILASRDKVGNMITLKRENTTTPLYVFVNVKDRPQSIVNMLPMSVGGIQIRRTFDRIDESQ